MSIPLLLTAIILIFLALEAFMSGSEMAIVAANRKRLAASAPPGSRLMRITMRILDEPSWYLSTALVGSNLAEVTNTALVTSILIGLYGPVGALYSFLILTPLVLIFGEIMPKSLFQQKADAWARKIVPVVWGLSILMYPLVWFMSKTTGLVLRLLGEKRGQGPLVTREDLHLLLRAEGDQGDMKPMERTMIHRILRFSGTKVREVMIPLVDVVVLEEGTTVEEAIALVRETNYSRYPVFRERVDKIAGLLHSFDLLMAEGQEGTIEPFIRSISFCPETKPIDELLVELQRNHETMAAVVDEYGGAVGIITVEDILEEVVGEIEDEYDVGPPLYRRVGPHQYLVNARIEIDRLNEVLSIRLPPGDYETLAGFLLDKMGRIPLPGEGLRFAGILFQIQRADERSIYEVLLTLKG